MKVILLRENDPEVAWSEAAKFVTERWLNSYGLKEMPLSICIEKQLQKIVTNTCDYKVVNLNNHHEWKEQIRGFIIDEIIILPSTGFSKVPDVIYSSLSHTSGKVVFL